MAGFRKFEEIDAWKLGRTPVRSIYAVTRKDPFSHDWGLRDQIRRAAVSICSNIAEGYARRGNKAFVKFLWIAKVLRQKFSLSSSMPVTLDMLMARPVRCCMAMPISFLPNCIS